MYSIPLDSNPFISHEVRVYAMTCAGYDAQFETVLARNHKRLTPPRLKSSKSNDSKTTVCQGKLTRNSTTPEPPEGADRPRSY